MSLILLPEKLLDKPTNTKKLFPKVSDKFMAMLDAAYEFERKELERIGAFDITPFMRGVKSGRPTATEMEK